MNFKRIRWYSILFFIETIYSLQICIHIIIVLILEAVYIMNENSRHLREFCYEWITFICPTDPDLKTTVIECYSILISFTLMYYYMKIGFVSKPHRDPRNLNLFLILREDKMGMQLVSDHFNNIIDEILASNSIFRRKHKFILTSSLTWKLEESYREYIYLVHLKRDKRRIWPRTRSLEWLKRLQAIYLILFYMLFILIYSLSLLVCTQLLLSSKIYRDSNKIRWTSSFLSRKMAFELGIMPFILANWFCSEFVPVVVAVLDQLTLTNETGKIIKDLLGFINHASEICTFDSPSQDNKSTTMRLKPFLRRETNMRAIDAYISSRYHFDMLVRLLPNISYYVDMGMCIVIFHVLVNLGFVRSINTVEWTAIMALVVALFVNSNILLVLCSYHYQNCMNQFKHMKKIVVSMIARVDKSNTRILVSPHVFLLWKRVSEASGMHRLFAVMVGNFIIIHYNTSIKLNLLASYTVVLSTLQLRR